MAIENRNLEPGTRLAARYRKQRYTCEVVAGEGDKLRYHLEDGREFKSPSAAGMAVTGKSCNGWAFWSISSPAPEAQPVETQPGEATRVEAAGTNEHPSHPAKKRIFRIPNQKGVPEGQVRWYCHDCGQSFLASVGETPELCPQGHQV